MSDTPKVIIPGNLKGSVPENIVTDALYILDSSRAKNQKVINDEFEQRIDDIQELAEISIEGGTIQIANAADFDNPTQEQRAKVPTVGAVIDGYTANILPNTGSPSTPIYIDNFHRPQVVTSILLPGNISSQNGNVEALNGGVAAFGIGTLGLGGGGGGGDVSSILFNPEVPYVEGQGYIAVEGILSLPAYPGSASVQSWGFTKGIKIGATSTPYLSEAGIITIPAYPNISGKADKVVNATEGNFASLDALGNLQDAGVNALSFATAAQGAKADAAEIALAQIMTPKGNHSLPVYINESGIPTVIDSLNVTGNIQSTQGGVSAFGMGSLALGAGGGQGTLTEIQIDGTTIPDVEGIVNLPAYPTWATLSGRPTLSAVATSGRFSDLTDTPTTLGGYGILDAKINNGVITLGSDSITPVTSHQTIYTLTVQKNGVTVDSFNAASTNKTINIEDVASLSAFNTLVGHLTSKGSHSRPIYLNGTPEGVEIDSLNVPGNIESTAGGVSAFGIASLSVSGGSGGGTLTQIQINGTALAETDGIVNIIADGTYNTSSNKLATQSSIVNALNTLDYTAIGASASKTLLSLTETNGVISATFQDISIAVSQVSGLQSALDNKLSTSLKGAANGLAELDSNGLVPSSQLPSYVDDVLEYPSFSDFPSTGTAGKIYVALDTNLTYRWSGTTYVEISPSLALGETSSTAYRGDRGAIAYSHATDASRLTTAQSTGFYKFSTTSEGHVAGVSSVGWSDITSLDNGTTYAPYNSAGYLPLSGGTMANTNLVANLNADLLDGVHLSGLFTLLENNNNQISITIGGENKKLTVDYANVAGRVGTTTVGSTSLPVYINSGTPTIIDSLSVPGDIQSTSGGVSAFGIASLNALAGGGSGTLTQIQINGTPLTDVSGVVNIPLASNLVNGAMAATDKSKLDNIEAYANNYVLPAATSGALGGIRLGYSTSGKNYPVQLDGSNKAFVNVPWENTTYSNGTGLDLSSGVFSINSTYQTYISNGNTAYGWGNHASAGYLLASTAASTYLPLTGGTLTGTYLPLIVKNSSQNTVGVRFAGSSGNLGGIVIENANGDLYRIDGPWNNQYKIWDAGNDGAGSGLNADLLDGREATGFVKKEELPRSGQSYNANSLTNAGTYYTTTGDRSSVQAWENFPDNGTSGPFDLVCLRGENSSYPVQFFHNYGKNDFWLRFKSWFNGGVNWKDWAKIWTSANHGSGSGLDADLLDGTHKADLFSAFTNDNDQLSSTIGGTNKKMTVGYASRSTDTKTELLTGQEFTYRQTAGGGLTYKPSSAVVKRILGNSVVWNQRIYDSNYYTTGSLSCYNCTASYSNGIATITGSSGDSSFILDNNGTAAIVGHKYYHCIVYKSNKAVNLYESGGSGAFGSLATSSTFTKYSDIATNNYAAASKGFGFFLYNATAAWEFQLKMAVSIDLTLFFNGNIPTGLTAETFERDYGYLLANPEYNAGTIINNSAEGLETVGFNLWDEEWESGDFTDDGQPHTNASWIRSKNFCSILPNTNYYKNASSTVYVLEYDSNKSYLGAKTGSSFTTSANARYFKLQIYGTTYNHDICINRSDPAKNGTYEPYRKNTLPLHLNSFRVKDAQGNISTINGLKKAGSVYDEIVGRKLIRRVGDVDLGTLSWARYVTHDSDYEFETTNIQGRVLSNNIVCSMYYNIGTTKDDDQMYRYPYGMCSGNSASVIKFFNPSLSTASVDTFKSSMNGVMLNYQLATPIEYEIIDEAPYEYPIDVLGTERIVSDELVAPFVADIQYGAEQRDIAYDIDNLFASSVLLRSRATTLEGYFTDGIANNAARLSNTSAIGSTTKPVYFTANGVPSACSTYAGGTAVTLNGSSKAALTASFYAATVAGTSGQILKSTAGTPEWINQSALVAGKATQLETSRTLWGQSFNGTADIGTDKYAKMPYLLFRTVTSGSDATIGYVGRDASNNVIHLMSYSGVPVSIGTGQQDDLYITTGHNVGIGTTNPSEKVHVIGNILSSGNIVANGGVAARGMATLQGGAGIGNPITQINVGSTAYTPSSGVVSLPAYPTWSTLSGKPSNVSAFTNDSGYIDSSALAVTFTTTTLTSSSTSVYLNNTVQRDTLQKVTISSANANQTFSIKLTGSGSYYGYHRQVLVTNNSSKSISLSLTDANYIYIGTYEWLTNGGWQHSNSNPIPMDSNNGMFLLDIIQASSSEYPVVKVTRMYTWAD